MSQAIYVNSTCGAYGLSTLCMHQPTLKQGPSSNRFRKKLFSWQWEFLWIYCFFARYPLAFLGSGDSPRVAASTRKGSLWWKEAGQLREGDAGEKSTWAGRKFFQDDVVKVSSVAFWFSSSRSCGTIRKTKKMENPDAIEETCTKKTLSPIDS